MAATVTDPLIGTIVDGRYEVRSRIARGGMATVYLATDRRLDRHVALKVMHPHLADGSDLVARFRREARSAARLSHPGVVGVYDQGTEGEASYLTMEYVDGSNLRRHLTAQGAMSVGEALETTDAILDALAAAHRAGLVHRDMKPENVLIARSGAVKVADFGLARALTEATMATTGTLLGTVAYLSPEIVTDGHADARADVYAVGVMLYEMLTGHQPFQGETAIQIAYKHVHSDVPAPSEAVAWLPLEVDDLVAAMTRRDPAARPADADAALRALRRARAGFDSRVLSMRADVEPDELAEIVQEATDEVDRTGVTASLGIDRHSGTVALPIGAVAKAHEEAEARQLRRRRRLRLLILALVVLTVLAAGATLVWWYDQHGPGSYTTTPEVVGEQESDALATIEAQGLVPVPQTRHSDEVAAGVVIATEPVGGERIEREGEVLLVISAGVLQIAMPEVIGETLEDAGGILTEAGMTGRLVIERRYDQEIAEGLVMSTDPQAEEVVAHSHALTLVVSAGREPISIPSVVGTLLADAENEIEDAGGVPQVSDRQHSDDIAEGHILSQSLTGPALRGDPVTLVVSLGPELVEVPNVVSDQYDQAAAALDALGFVVEREDVLLGFFGTVRSQSVEPGTMLARGSTIVLTVV